MIFCEVLTYNLYQQEAAFYWFPRNKGTFTLSGSEPDVAFKSRFRNSNCVDRMEWLQ